MNAEVKKMSQAEMITKITALEEAVQKLTDKVENRRGPKSQRQMTEDDAKRIMLGDLKTASHKDAAEKLGLSYGQIYSARKGFTYKEIYNDMVKAEKAAKK